jgi:trehalose/maltose transport system permease protein
MIRRLRRRIIAFARLTLVGLVVLYTLFPFYWAVVSSLKTSQALFDTAFLPLHPSLDNYSAALLPDLHAA